MPNRQVNILSIAPYKILPPTSGGHLGIVTLHHYLGKLCQDHLVSTVDNGPADNYAFDLHKVFPADAKRYIPLYNYRSLLSIAKKYDVNHIYCDHPYMAPTVMALSRKLKVPWYLRSHNIESERFRAFGKKWWPVMRSFERFAMRNANGVFFITPEEKEWAMQNFGLHEHKSFVIPYGTTLEQAPNGHDAAKQQIAAEMGLDPAKPWLYFIGALDYYPNEQAVSFILDEVIRRLNESHTQYEILVGGKGLSEKLQQQIKETPNITYTGFIPVLDTFLKACDIMLNPVVLGGGIKTKAIEALGYNKIVVSTFSGAAGISPQACGNNLLISEDKDWYAFVADINTAILTIPDIPKAFYDSYYWGNIAKKILDIFKQH